MNPKLALNLRQVYHFEIGNENRCDGVSNQPDRHPDKEDFKKVKFFLKAAK
jgi:hypothetical protein